MATEGFTGMAALIRSLETLPDQLRQESAGIIHATADLMAAELRTTYPAREGHLRAGVVVEASAASETRVKVRSKAPHAHLYEFGTVQRFTGRGAHRGTMPAQPTFIPIAQRRRRGMVERLIAVVRRARVSGMTGSLEVRDR